MTPEEREEISRGICHGDSMSQIARFLGKAPSTVTREVKANGGRDSYRIWPAHLQAQNNTKRPKVSKLANLDLRAKVTSLLKELWSPEEISNRLRMDFPGNEVMSVSHETIYEVL